jgi:hypothetical protein
MYEGWACRFLGVGVGEPSLARKHWTEYEPRPQEQKFVLDDVWMPCFFLRNAYPAERSRVGFI